MFEIVWEFHVREGCEREFEEAYGPDGVWAKLFAGSSDYRGTTLLRDHEHPRRYLTIDRWHSADAFERFRSAIRERYAALDQAYEALTENETRIGFFEVLP